MKQSLSIYILLVLGLLLSCSPKYYSPNTQNVPLLSEQGEVQVNLAGNASQVEFQGAYALAPNVGVQANGGLFIPKELDNGNGGSGKFLELGAGYFRPIGNRLVFETYGLLGLGSMENHLPTTVVDHPQTSGDISAGILRLGIQPSLGFRSDYFQAGVSARLANLVYRNIKGDLIFDGENQVDYLENNRSNLLFEPALTLRGGSKTVKLQTQIGYSLNLVNSGFRQDQGYGTIAICFRM